MNVDENMRKKKKIATYMILNIKEGLYGKFNLGIYRASHYHHYR